MSIIVIKEARDWNFLYYRVTTFLHKQQNSNQKALNKFITKNN